MNIHEHQAKQILKKYGVPVPEGIFALTVDELIEKATLRVRPILLTSITTILGLATLIFYPFGLELGVMID